MIYFKKFAKNIVHKCFIYTDYYITSDGYMILSSEVGVLPVDEEKIVLKERLHPGKMLLVDTVQGLSLIHI